MGRDVEPFETPDEPQDQRVLLEEFVILEPDDVVVVDVMPEVLVSHVFVGAVGSAAQPAHRAPERRIVTAAFEHQVVSALVNQVRGNRHRVCQQQGRHAVHNPGFVEQACETGDVADDGVQ